MIKRSSFEGKWIHWIKGCLTLGTILVLVNSNPTSEFLVQKGLRQGHPLTPFLFTIVSERLCGIMREAIERNLYTSFLVGDGNVKVNLLQYANDTFFFG